MKKRIIPTLLCIAMVFVLCACGTQPPVEGTAAPCPETFLPQPPSEDQTESPDTTEIITVEQAVERYNNLIDAYNASISAYNVSVVLLVEANAALDKIVSESQKLLESGETPFNLQTVANLGQAIENALEERVPDTLELPVKEPLTVSAVTAQQDREEALTWIYRQTEALQSEIVPEPLAIPDYSTSIAILLDAQTSYERSIKVQKQVTAPQDAFIMDRLPRIDSILSFDAVTQNNDPNGLLGAEGGYIGCIYFSDSQVDKEKLNLKPNQYDVITMGTVGGGAIEIFSCVDDAVARNQYLASYDGTATNPGSHVVIGTLVIRISSMLTTDQQLELTNEIIAALTALDGEY